jgi:hypothetical protein
VLPGLDSAFCGDGRSEPKYRCSREQQRLCNRKIVAKNALSRRMLSRSAMLACARVLRYRQRPPQVSRRQHGGFCCASLDI